MITKAIFRAVGELGFSVEAFLEVYLDILAKAKNKKKILVDNTFDKVN